MSIEYKSGNLLFEEVDAFVIPVNCVGVIGKGIFQQIKEKFPENYIEYVKACRGNLLSPGKTFVVKTNHPTTKFIVNLPTKNHWKEKSSLENIEKGLLDLKEFVETNNIQSIAFSPLATNLDNLPKKDLKNLITTTFENTENLKVVAFTKLTQENLAKPIKNIDLDNESESILTRLSLSNSNNFFEEGAITYNSLTTKEKELLSDNYALFFNKKEYELENLSLTDKEHILQDFYNDYSAVKAFNDYQKNEKNNQLSSPFSSQQELAKLKNFYQRDVRLSAINDLAAYSKNELNKRVFPKGAVIGSPFVNTKVTETISLQKQQLKARITRNLFNR